MVIRTIQNLVTEAKSNVVLVSAAEAAALGAGPDTVFVDVREADELHKTGTIAGAVHVPRGLLEFQADPASPSHKPELDPAKRIVLFCASGGRSALAARTLQAMGFSDVASVEGGFTALAEAGMPTTKA